MRGKHRQTKYNVKLVIHFGASTHMNEMTSYCSWQNRFATILPRTIIKGSGFFSFQQYEIEFFFAPKNSF